MSWPEAVFYSVAIIFGAPCAVAAIALILAPDFLPSIIKAIRGQK